MSTFDINKYKLKLQQFALCGSSLIRVQIKLEIDMMNSEIACDFGSAIGSENDEVFKLFESDDKREKIILNRSVQQQVEYIMLSPNLSVPCKIHNPLGSNVLSMDQYHLILRHKRSIQLYQMREGTLELFYLFFRMTTSEFFDSISLEV